MPVAAGSVEKMKKLFAKDPHAHIIDFIDAAVDTREIIDWLEALAQEPDHMRTIRLAEIKHKMEFSQAPEQHIEIIELLNSADILEAMNDVIKDVQQSGLKTNRFVKRKDATKYNILISLIAATHK